MSEELYDIYNNAKDMTMDEAVKAVIAQLPVIM